MPPNLARPVLEINGLGDFPSRSIKAPQIIGTKTWCLNHYWHLTFLFAGSYTETFVIISCAFAGASISPSSVSCKHPFLPFRVTYTGTQQVHWTLPLLPPAKKKTQANDVIKALPPPLRLQASRKGSVPPPQEGCVYSICCSLFIAREAEERKGNGRAFSEGSFAAIFAPKKTGRVQYRYEYVSPLRDFTTASVRLGMPHNVHVVPTVLMFSVSPATARRSDD